MLNECVYSPDGPRVRRDGESRRRHLDLAPGRDQERSYLLFRLGRLTYTSLIDVESKKNEEFRD
jgi:hypothetical protein